jgi:hypothetical protein
VTGIGTASVIHQTAIHATNPAINAGKGPWCTMNA